MRCIRVQTERIDHSPAVDAAGLSGACVRFSGVARTNTDHSLSHLVLEHFPGVTEQEIERIVNQACDRWALHGVVVIHRVGRIAVGEEVVRVETASAHRRAAYEANAYIMDYLKTQAPFWKQEGFVDGRATWVQPRDSDQQAQQRWAADAPSPLRLAPRIGAVILAGGRGQRMGAVNKGLQPLAGQPLIQHVLAAIQPQVDAVVISANRDLPAYRALGHPVVPDEAPWHGLGPLAGIASALPHVPAHLDAILTVPCDTPFLPADLVHRLAQVLFAAEAHAAVVATTPDGQHAGIALFRPLAAWSLPRALQSAATRSLRHWLASLGSSAVLFDDADVLANCNDLAALQAADQALRAP